MSKPFKGWDKVDRRWRKMLKGERFEITPEDLGLPQSKWNEADSTPAARQWWARIKAEKVLESPALNQSLIEELESRISTAHSLGMIDEVEFLGKRLKWVKEDKREYGPQEIFMVLNKLATPFESNPDASGVSTFENDLWNDRKRRVQPVEENRTAKFWQKKFLDHHADQAEIAGKSIGRYGNIKTGMTRFIEWFGAERNIADLNDEIVEPYFKHCVGKVKEGGYGNSPDTWISHFQVFKQFVGETTPQAKIPFPESIRLAKWQIPKARTEVNPFTVEEIKIIVINADRQMKAYLMLMLNCGYYQGDLADLDANEVDWKIGRINRARSKKKNAMKGAYHKPIKINWKLWDETFEAMKLVGNRTGKVFHENGKPLKIEKLNLNKDGVRSSSRQDKMSRMFGKYVAQLVKRDLLPESFDKTLSDLRKTGADTLEHSEQHFAARDAYLNHESLAAKNYIQSGKIKPSFDAAVKWFGEQLGFATGS